MEFTEPFPTAFGLVRLSTDGTHIASVAGEPRRGGEGALIVQSTRNGAVVRTLRIPAESFPATPPGGAAPLLAGDGRARKGAGLAASGDGARLCPLLLGAPYDLVWAPSNTRLALVLLASARVVVFDVDVDEPICIIQENRPLGLERILWAPDSMHILTVLRHAVSVKLWRLDQPMVRQIFRSPKASDRGVRFSADGRWMAMLHRKGSQDRIVIYDCFTASWEAVQQVQCPETSYLEDISFAPIKETALDGRPPVVAWEGPAFTGRMFVFAADGQSCKVITREGEDVLFSMGSARLTWSGDGLVAACIHNGESLTIWNAISQKMSPRIHVGPAAAGGQEHGRQGSGRVVVFKERITRELSSPHGTIVDRSKYESGFYLALTPLSQMASASASSGPWVGRRSQPLLSVAFSCDSLYIAAVSCDYPNALWIVSVVEMAVIAVLHQVAPIRSFTWHDSNPLLTLVTDSPNVYIWQPTGCLCIPQPVLGDARLVRWAPLIDTLVVASADAFTLAVPSWSEY